MKKTMYLLFVILLMLWLVGCKNDENANKTPIPTEEIVEMLQADIRQNDLDAEQKNERTITNFDDPDIQIMTLQDETSYFYKIDDGIRLDGKEVYKVTFHTESDGLLGPIVYYVDCYTGQIYGMDFRG